MEASSAHTRAPKKVNAPEISQTRKTPGIEGTCPVISEGWTKIEAPIMMPTTMAVAWGRPIALLSSGADFSSILMALYHQKVKKSTSIQF
jgi:hypothetical protein